ncbi:MAG: flagellar basal-body MS-ring/collar protein FliF [Bacillota bacterium]|nr:flagellar basal-body MS-ring/collar protein FliF [Bacillota bacterium]
MNETVMTYLNKIKLFWMSQTKKQKLNYMGLLLLLALVIGVSSYFATRTTLVPLYSNLSPSETGQIKQSLDAKGIQNQIADGGSTIEVPDNVVDSLKVQLAAEGLPKSGSIDYSFFSQNAGLGTTDNEFNVLKLDAMQTELSNLIKGIDGVQDAKVMITLPDKGIFVTDKDQQASASVVLNLKPGYQFRDDQVTALYNLVSKSVPNLPTDNIVITDQYFNYYDLNKNKNSGVDGSTFASQVEVRKQVERDVQQQVQTMLGTLMGQGKAVVSVTADVDFNQETDTENLVEPVDKDNMKGIAISAENISETYSGTGNPVGGTPQSQSTSDTGTSYVAGSNSNGDYEKIDNKVNYEVNRIHKQIVQSPYKIRDLGIQVMVEPPNPKNPKSLPKSTVNDITKILGTIVRTSVDKTETGKALTNADIKNRVVVSVQPFNGKTNFTNQVAQTSIPWWIYLIGGLLLLVIVLLLILFMRARKKRKLEEETPVIPEVPLYVPDVNEEQENENSLRRKQLEKMAKENPEDFAKLLRTWIAED